MSKDLAVHSGDSIWQQGDLERQGLQRHSADHSKTSRPRTITIDMLKTRQHVITQQRLISDYRHARAHETYLLPSTPKTLCARNEHRDAQAFIKDTGQTEFK